jgi:hypothetical protein
MSDRQISNPTHWTAAQSAIVRILIVIVAVVAMCSSAAAQGQPYYAPEQLDRLVSPVALYPDPLLAQVLAAATFPDEIPDAARWADQHHHLSGDQLAQQINYDQLPWDPSVQALLPFPAVLNTMASDMDWTNDLGNAFLSNQQDVMYAVQRMRQRARDYGYLRTGPQMVVSNGPYITIMPARPDYIVVPSYDPVVVYERPRPGFFVGAAIGFRFGVGLGVAYRPWGWGYNRIAWNERVVIVNNAPWHRTWINRHEYVHPYTIRRVVVHDHEWNAHHEAMERERERWAHEREEHREEVRHEERREEHREAERRERERHDVEERRERERHEADERREREARFAHERDERREAGRREAERREHEQREDRRDDHRAVQEAHRDNVRVDQRPAQEAHRDNVRVDQRPAQEAHRDNVRVDQRPAQEAHRDNQQVRREDHKDDRQKGKSDDHRKDDHDKNKHDGDGHGR